MNFPEHREQEAEHRDLTVTLDKIIWRAERSVTDGDGAAIVEELANLLRRWVLNHIIGHDLKMKPYAAALRRYERDLPTLKSVCSSRPSIKDP